jgi:hypothetical protein
MFFSRVGRYDYAMDAMESKGASGLMHKSKLTPHTSAGPEQRGELSAAVELRRLFPGITDTSEARECARTIAGWKPCPARCTRCRGYARDATPVAWQAMHRQLP